MGLRGAILAGLGKEAKPGRWTWAYRLVPAAIVLVSIADASLSTLPDLSPHAVSILQSGALLCGALFALEWVLRLWLAPQLVAGHAGARRAYLHSFLGLVDLGAAASLLTLAGREPHWRDATLLLQSFAVLKLARAASGLSLIVAVMRNEARSLLAALVTMLTVLFLASTLMYLIERDAQPEIFSSIPASLWWGIVTMGTVGYGDMTPLTPLGRVFGGGIILIGVAMFAVPAGILATGFAAELKRRDFVVSWHAVAKVPLFSGLDATRIATIAALLKPQIVPERQVIIRRGEPADAMFFVMEGEVEVDVHPVPVRLAKGQFFGEIALIKEVMRTATVTALKEVRLLRLERADFQHLMTQYPELKSAIERIAETRLSALQKQG